MYMVPQLDIFSRKPVQLSIVHCEEVNVIRIYCFCYSFIRFVY